MKRRDLIRHLLDHGCELVREGGSHSWWGNPLTGARSAVPRHREISNHRARKICRDHGFVIGVSFGLRLSSLRCRVLVCNAVDAASFAT